ncbi:MAG: hypothetical protein QW291_04410 [Thermofilaceae archaeon]
MSLPKLIYKARQGDNVGTALGDLEENLEYPIFEEGKGITGTIRVITPVLKWHKVALEEVYEDEKVIKFGYPIGIAVTQIVPGTIVHITNIILDSRFDFKSLVRKGFVLGEATAKIEKGGILRISRNFRPLHPDLKDEPVRSKVGIAATSIAEGAAVRLGNIIDLNPERWHNERYKRLIRDFYRLLKAGLIDFTRVQV